MKIPHLYKSRSKPRAMLFLSCLLCCGVGVPLRAQTVVNISPDGDQATLAAGTDILFSPGDIWNIAGTFTSGAITDVNAQLGAVYVNGPQSFCLIGDGITASTGTLYLGWDANTGPGVSPFSGVLDFTGLGANTFAGVELDGGALRVSSAAQLGVTLSRLNFLGAPAASGTLQIAANSAVDFDNGAGDNRLVVAAGHAASFLVEDGATLAFSNGNSATALGLSIYVNNNATLTLDAQGSGGYLFDSNTSTFATGGQGGAIYSGSGATTLINSATFLDNHSNTQGGAIANYAGHMTILNSAFIGNNTLGATSNGGGAIADVNIGAVLSVTNALFQDNTSNSNGGAILYNSGTAATGSGGMTFTSATFAGNHAFGGDGGAIYANVSNGNYGTIVLNDVSFTGNTATGNGGAVFVSSRNDTISYNVSAGQTSLVAGNTDVHGANSFYFAQNQGMALNIDVAAGGTLAMLDPIYVFGPSLPGNQPDNFTKTGTGVWGLGGDTVIDAQNNTSFANFTIGEGTLHLYRAGETVGGCEAATGNITAVTSKSAAFSFTVGSGATLSVGGGNTIDAGATITTGANSGAGSIIFKQGSILSFDLSGYDATGGLQVAGSGASLLTLSAGTFDYSTGGLFNFGLDLTGLAGTGTFNLLSASDAFAPITDNGASLLSTSLLSTLAGYGLSATDGIENGILWLALTDLPQLAPHEGNLVLTWTGSSNNRWLGFANWKDTDGNNLVFAQGDIINFAGDDSGSTTATIALADTATASAIYFSGAKSYAISGAGNLVTDAASGTYNPAVDQAATGKLILGASALLPSSFFLLPFTGTLDLTGMTGDTANNFAGGIDIYGGVLRVSTNAQFGTTLSHLNFLVDTAAATASGAVEIAPDGALVFAGDATANRLVVTTNHAAAFLVDDGANLTIADGVSASPGAAIYVEAGARLTLDAQGAGGYLFESNTTTTTTALGIGGAISGTGAVMFVTNGTFRGNYSSSNGGGIANSSGTLTVLYSDFVNNYSTTGGGALSAVNNNSTTEIAGALFESNSTGGNGGAILYNTNTGAAGAGVMTITSATFAGNHSGGIGGAIYSNGNGEVVLNDVSFVNNSAATNGGAMGVTAANNTVYYNVSPGGVSLVAGNTDGNHGANGIFIGNNQNIQLHVDVGAGGTLAMLDPVYVNGAATNATTLPDYIDKTGPGTWNLGGNTTVDANSNNAFAVFTVAEGTLHLYRAGEGAGGYEAATGNMTVAPGKSASFSFEVRPGATLSAGGGNVIDTGGGGSITLGANSTIALDLAGAALNGPASSSILTLNAPLGALNANAWAQILDLLNPSSLNLLNPNPGNGDYYDLITLGNGNLFTADPNTLFTLDAALADAGYILGLNDGGATLALLYNYSAPVNGVLTWTGAAGDNLWAGSVNWTTLGAGVKFTQGDIINLASATPAPALGASNTISVNAATSATVSGIYVSGTQSYTITGAPIVSATGAGSLSAAAAATGKLILGARASDAADILDQGPAAAFSGTLTLANTAGGANNFQNGIVINSGELVGDAQTLNAGASLATPAPATPAPGILDNGTLTFAQTVTATYAAPITGTGVINKNNAGALTLAADSGAFTGTTNVNAGDLLLNAGVGASQATPAAALGGNIRVAPNATFGGSGAAGAINLSPDATLQVGLRTPDSGLRGSGTLALTGDLLLSAGSILDYGIYAGNGGSADLLDIGGSLTQGGASIINVSQLLSSGSVALIDAAGGLSAFNTGLLGLTVASISSTDAFFAKDDNILWLVFTGGGVNPPVTIANNSVLTWTGAAGDNAWAGSVNWIAPGTGTTFTQGDIVNLAGAATPPVAGASNTIALAATATVAGMYVSGTESYAITGAAIVTATGAASTTFSGSAAASGKLVLGGSAAPDAGSVVTTSAAAFAGTLDFSGQDAGAANSFIGGVDIRGGALRISSAGQLGTTLSRLNFPGAPAASGTLVIASAANVVFNNSAGDNRLVVASGAAANFLVEDGANLAFTNGNSSAVLGLAIYVNNGASLTLGAQGSGGYLFASNTSTSASGGQGGAIYSGSLATTLIASATFLDNHSNNQGGAVANYAGRMTVLDSVFIGNNTLGASSGGGGAIADVNIGAVLDVTGALFQDNTSNTSGGALLYNSGTAATGSGSLTVTSATFANNHALGGDGGAISANVSNGNYGAIVFNDVTFTGNTATGNGGAIFVSSRNDTIAYNVSAGQTSLIAGNTDGNHGASSFYFAQNQGMELNVSVGAGGTLAMLDPIYVFGPNAASNIQDYFTKDGAGVWGFGGTTIIDSQNTNGFAQFTISAGEFHLYRDGEIVGGYRATTGSIISGSGGAGFSFDVQRGATLSVGGGNRLSAGNSTVTHGGAASITFEPGSILSFDIGHYHDVAGASDIAGDIDGTPMLTISAGVLTYATGGAASFALDVTGLENLSAGGTFNLLAASDNLAAIHDQGASLLTASLQAGFANYGFTATDGITNSILWLGLAEIPLLPSHEGNSVLTWTGSSSVRWLGFANWKDAASPALVFAQGDIVNFTGANTANDTVVLTDSATASGIYFSGSKTYALTGAGNLVTAVSGTYNPAVDQAATGKLILGASALLPSSFSLLSFTGVLDLTGMNGAANNFTGGVDIYGGALRVSSTAQLGAPLSRVNFLGTPATTTGTLVLAANATLAFDGGATGADNRLALADGAAASFLVEDGATLAFANASSASAPGAAIYAGSGATLALNAAGSGAYVFESNTSAARGGAMSGTGAAMLVNGAAFLGNYAGDTGGAIGDSSGTLTVLNSAFTGNYAAGSGGAISAVNNNSAVTITNALFDGNTSAANGGAILYNTATSAAGDGVMTITSATFAGNHAAGNGGAIYENVSPNTGALLVLNDVSFTGNSAGDGSGGNANGNGGAISVTAANGAVFYNVSPGQTSLVAGNTDTNHGANGIFLANNQNLRLSVNVGAGGVLAMLDPVYVNGAATNATTLPDYIDKTGPGTWNLGGSTTIDANSSNAFVAFTVAQGTLHLYRAGETAAGYEAATGGIIAAPGKSASFSFEVRDGATLSAGGGNIIDAGGAGSITLGANSTIALDLAGAAPNTGASSAILTLNAPLGALDAAGWTQTLALLNLSLVAPSNNTYYDLITLGGGNLFTDDNLASFNFAAPLDDGYSLRLLYSGTTLALYYNLAVDNRVITWAGVTGSSWSAAGNWEISGTSMRYNQGDIVNLAGAPGGTPSASSAAIAVDTTTSATVAGIYVSGTQSYTITGAAIVSATGVGTLSGSAAATGKLILGAFASDDAGNLDQSPAAAFTGTLTLANTAGGANNFQNGIVINSGELVGNAQTLNAGASLATPAPAAPAPGILDNGTLTFDQAVDDTYAAPITGTGVINKNNTGALTLAADNSAFTGVTNVHAGALILGAVSTGGTASVPSPAALGGDLNLSPDTTLAGAGALGNVTTLGSATITIGLPRDNSALQSFSPSILSMSGALTLAGPTTFNYDISGSACDLITAATLVRNGSDTIDISANTSLSGTYTLMSISNGLAATATDHLITLINGDTPSDRTQATFIIDNTTNLALVIHSTNAPGLVWDGTNGSTWKDNYANWKTSDGKFLNGDSVTFDDTLAGSRAVAIDAIGVQVAAMLVSATGVYTFTGGAITASATLNSTLDGTADATGKLTIDGGGLVILDNTAGAANTFDGGIDILSGTLQGSAATLAAPAIANAGALVFSQTAAATYSAAITGPGLIVMGASSSQTLTLTNTANTYAGGITVLAGALAITLPDPATLGAVAISSGGALDITTNTAFTIADHSIDCAGLLGIDAGGNPVTAGAFAAPPAFTGTLALANSTFALAGDNTAFLANATLRLDPGNTTTVGAAAQTIAALSLNGGLLSFSDTVPAAPAATGIIQTTDLALASGTIQIDIPRAPAPAAPGASLFAQTATTITQLITATRVTGSVINLSLVDQNNAPVASPVTAPITQNNATVATGSYNYYLDATGGLNVKYGLTALTIADGQTLTLAPAPGENGLFSATISGNGNLAIDAAGGAPVTLAAASNYTGATTIASGTLIAGASNALGATSTLALAPDAAFSLGARTQTIGALAAAAGSSLNLGTGALTITAGGAFAGALAGTGALNLAGGNLAVTTATTAYTGPVAIAATATATLASASALGAGAINLAGALTFANTDSGTFTNPLSGSGALNFTGAGAVTIANDNTAYTGQAAIAPNAAAIITATAALGATGPATVDGSLTLAFSPSAIQTFSLSVAGTGTLTLAASTGTTILSGNNTIASINILAGASVIAASAGSLGAATTRLAMTDATITLIRNNTAIGNLAMNGASVIGFAKNLSPGNTATFASLSSTGANATLAFNTDIGAGVHDTFNITGPATGAFRVTINNTGDAPDTAKATLKLVNAAPGSNASYTGAGTLDFGDMRLYDWNIATANGSASLNLGRSAALGPTGQAVLAGASGVMPLTWFAELDTLSKRLGDLLADPRQKPGPDLWMRASAQRLNVNARDTLVAFNEDQYGTEVGIDYGGRPTGYGAATYVGVFAGCGSSSRDVASMNASADTASAHAGVYATIITPAGWYVDLAGKYDHLKNTLSATLLNNGAMNASYANDALGLSLEAGKRIDLGKNWYLTPGVQAALARITPATYDTRNTAPGSDLSVTQSQVTSRQVRAGVQAGYKLLTATGQLVQPYVKAGVAQQSTQGGLLTVAGSDAQTPEHYTPIIEGTRLEAGVGVNWQVMKTFQVYLEYETAWAKDYQKPYGLSVGATYAW